MEAAQRLGCVAVVANQGLYQPALLEQIHQAGMAALAYTVNEPDNAARLQAMGLDGLITDAVNRLGPGGPGRAWAIEPGPACQRTPSLSISFRYSSCE